MNRYQNNSLAWMTIVFVALLALAYTNVFRLAQTITANAVLSVTCNDEGECHENTKIPSQNPFN